MNQPVPLASSSMRRVPAMGWPLASKRVSWASASWPVGRSLIAKFRSNGVWFWRKDVQVGMVAFERL